MVMKLNNSNLYLELMDYEKYPYDLQSSEITKYMTTLIDHLYFQILCVDASLKILTCDLIIHKEYEIFVFKKIDGDVYWQVYNNEEFKDLFYQLLIKINNQCVNKLTDDQINEFKKYLDRHYLKIIVRLAELYLIKFPYKKICKTHKEAYNYYLEYRKEELILTNGYIEIDIRGDLI